jgi:diguanylate cyclase (GGDEF)-like protein
MNRKEQILVVDDDVSINALGSSLAKHYQVLGAKNGIQALKIIKSNPQIDLILLDVQASENNGFEICKKIKSNRIAKDIPLMFISINKNEDAEERSLSMGAVDFIARPFSQTILELRVKNQLKLKRQRDLLKHLSRTDSLTGMWNRSKFDEFLKNEWLRAIREQTWLSLIMIDIDSFKKFNDLYGHTRGDECIKKITQAIKKSIDRSQDLAARFGGEEFICVLPNTTLSGAVHIAETIRKNCLKLKVPHEGSQITPFVTVSLGVSSIIPNRSSSAQLLIQTADKMLYKAKRDGRNKVVSDSEGK